MAQLAVDTLYTNPAKPTDGASSMDGAALRGEIASLARAHSGDKTALRKAVMELIRASFLSAREQIKAGMNAGHSPGLAVARTLSALQDTTIALLYDCAVRHFYPAPNPTSAERLSVVATGGYGRGLLAPFSDIDLLFIRPFKETAWDESVIEFILHMLWDLNLKVGHATRSVAECVRLSKQDITIRTSLLESRYLWGDRELFDEMRRKFWSDVAASSGKEFVDRSERAHV